MHLYHAKHMHCEPFLRMNHVVDLKGAHAAFEFPAQAVVAHNRQLSISNFLRLNASVVSHQGLIPDSIEPVLAIPATQTCGFCSSETLPCSKHHQVQCLGRRPQFAQHAQRFSGPCFCHRAASEGLNGAPWRMDTCRELRSPTENFDGTAVVMTLQ